MGGSRKKHHFVEINKRHLEPHLLTEVDFLSQRIRWFLITHFGRGSSGFSAQMSLTFHKACLQHKSETLQLNISCEHWTPADVHPQLLSKKNRTSSVFRDWLLDILKVTWEHLIEINDQIIWNTKCPVFNHFPDPLLQILHPMSWQTWILSCFAYI